MKNIADPLFFFACYTTVFLAILTFTLTNMAGVYIVSDIGGSPEIAVYTICYYGFGNAIGVPLGRALRGLFGTGRLLVYCLLLFLLFTILCGTAPTYPIFVGYRFFLGLVSGPFYVLIGELLETNSTPEQKHSVSATLLMLFTVVPALGAGLGGWIGYESHWRWLFHITVPIIAWLAWFFWRRIRDLPPNPSAPPMDGVGFWFLALGVFCLGTVATTIQQLDWYRSPTINICEVVGGLSLLFFILWDLHHPNPILNVRLFKNLVFCFSFVNIALLFATYFGSIILLTMWLQLYAEYTPLWISVLIGSMILAAAIPSVLIHKRYEHLDRRIPIAISLVLLATSCFYSSTFDVEINFGRLAFTRLLTGFGLAFFLPPLFQLCTRSVGAAKTTEGIELFQMARILGSALGGGIFLIVWQRRQVFYHYRLGGALTPLSEVTQQFFVQAKRFHLEGQYATAQLNDYLDRQATALGLEDTFYLMGWIIVGLCVLLLLTFLIRSPETRSFRAG
ncbi:MAG: DHA2 family efflux MFS transporter permease subunit [Verrucomicrobiota bacterium]|nr:DHA2 family efflux MFS transporter permease subunit [Verrucomicrobiota bacterium]